MPSSRIDEFQATGHPVHTRSLEIEVFAGDAGGVIGRGAILDPARGHSEIAAADRWMTEHGIHAPGRFARILIPGLDRPAR